ncbi:MAG: primosomal protein N' [Desulfobulbaceae bacterium]|nr:primosomal protein N' [Desulfobulbaceae bacterium]
MDNLLIAVAAPLFEPLTYKVQVDGTIPPVGVRVLVSLGRRRVTGYVIGTTPPRDTTYKIKPILDILDKEPLFHANMVPFFTWAADYYQYPIGEVIKGALPGGLTISSGRIITLTPTGVAPLSEVLTTAPQKYPWLATLLEKQKLTMAMSQKVWLSKDRRTLLKWQDLGHLTITETTSKPQVSIKEETCIRLMCQNDANNLKKSEIKTLAAVTQLKNKGLSEISQREVLKLYPNGRAALRELADRGIIELYQHIVHRDPLGDQPVFYPKPEQLSAEQEQVLGAINPKITSHEYESFLLHGVTGSGKTEVYLRAAETALAQKRGVIVLVPEIALATQIEAHFHSRFGGQIALIHSGLSQGEKFDQWRRIACGEATIVIGARSAIFAPIANLGLVIVDEEHDSAYKQEDNFRYHARDLAIVRARQQQGVIILGSATPAVTSFYNGYKGKFTTLTMGKRVADRRLPAVTVVDLKRIPTLSGQPPLFSPELRQALIENFAAGNQSLIFLNRRGYASLMLCLDCGTSVNCPHCEVSLTLHKKDNNLSCHYCGFTMHAKPICAQCNSANVHECGFGTERIEQELQLILPKANVARLDRDTSSGSRKNFIKILQGVRDQSIDVLVGTQMIAKGHHFPHVTLVGVIWADTGLSLPDYKAGERTFQLMSQVTGRAGRGEKPGRVIIQTYQPHHYAITAASEHDYLSLYDREISLRDGLSYPPFSRLINIKFSGEEEQLVRQAALESCRISRQIKLSQPVDILGPAQSPIPRLRKRFRYQFLLKSNHLPTLSQLARTIRENPPPLVRSGKVRMTLDVDPDNMI